MRKMFTPIVFVGYCCTRCCKTCIGITYKANELSSWMRNKRKESIYNKPQENLVLIRQSPAKVITIELITIYILVIKVQKCEGWNNTYNWDTSVKCSTSSMNSKFSTKQEHNIIISLKKEEHNIIIIVIIIIVTTLGYISLLFNDG